MLTALSIKNYALIEDINMSLDKGFTIMTGETGAGKSIILGALGLLLGDRADFSAIRNPEKKCVIEGSFGIVNYKLEKFFEKEDLDYEPNSIIRREILPSGKSRAFINDTPVKISALQKLGSYLIDIHSQHETLSLGNAGYQFDVIDTIAGNEAVLIQYKKELRNFKALQARFAELKEEQARAAREYDYNVFLLNELEEAHLKEGMQDELEERYEELNNVEELTENLNAAINNLQQEEIGSLETLKSIRNSLSKISQFSTSYESFYERVNSVIIELDDLETEMTSALDRIEANPEELEMVNQKLQLIYNLQKKHNAENVEELIAITESLRKEVSVTENAENSLKEIQREIEAKKEELQKIASELHAKRDKIIPVFVEQTEKILADLGMPNARLKIQLDQTAEFLTNGQDKLEWFLAANKGGTFKEMKKAASGGELSRIMLAVKSILAAQSNLPTIIFDEIDTGVSGDIASRMGEILQKMGANMQVIAITHLPQIAGKGSSHFKIYKEDNDDATQTKIVKLGENQRVEELALMLGGNTKSESALAHAKALLN
ncbi:DNA repair protein RecN [Christiangramia flava]|uniref:DNA repair protein RecN n=1 Tax=Christiangramia flava JLT2011 TaxID=1229726 RepID=A0A1L7I1R8_9FLAO|nr:DNA repair protein RecN [Christiangramia flava]APU67144.1 DNA repair protein RecN [Christiangramia flava JLT2011]OSS38084.1 DNA repair protein RecN [Christiangramia flava JLT2011]